MPDLSRHIQRSIGFAVLALTGFAAALIVLEGLVELLLRHPQAAASLLRPAHHVSHLKNYYLAYDRSVIQLRDDCAMYDEILTYRLRPGSCTVANREHTIEYSVNRAGLRDTDTRLGNPEIIVTGDSQAMGWGVRSEATLARRIEALTGRTTLNAAVSSYETVREMVLLRELIKPSTEYVVIAYCNNDYHTNWSAIASGEAPRLTSDAYARKVAEHAQTSRYFPFRHVWQFVSSVTDSFWRAQPPALLATSGFAAMNFLALLDAERDLLRGRHVIVFEANAFNQNDAKFVTALRAAASQSDLLTDFASMHVIDASSLLVDDDYFLLDDHLRESGHDKLAHEIAAIVGGTDRWRVKSEPRTKITTPSGDITGYVDRVDQKAKLTIIYGWAARRDTGEPAASVVLLRDGLKVAETEPVFRREDVARWLDKPLATYAGYALTVRSDRIANSNVEVVAKWSDGAVGRLAQ